MKDTKIDKIVKRKLSNKSSLSDFLKRLNKMEKNEAHYSDIAVDEYKLITLEYLQQNPQELLFEFTPREIIFSLLEGIQNYPVLWEFHKEAYNEDYSKAIEYLCELMNDKWLLNIEPLQMRRSITRILRFYRFLFPFDIIEQFTDYFDKCAAFLPSAVIEIPHARCFQCWRCFKRDRDLVKHMVAEHENLGWPYKCLHCHESFATKEEYEFHKNLPHYLEVFTCQECNQKFDNFFSYNRHYPHQKPELPHRYICDICQKDFKNKRVLEMHKDIHKDKRFKCHLCSNAYYMKSNLNTHLRKHRMDLKYICEVCGKGFVLNRDLKSHMDVHNDFKVTCNICNLQMRKTNLFRHLRTVHVVYEGTIESNFRAKGYRYRSGMYKELPTFKPNYQRRGRFNEKFPRHYECKICKIKFDRLKDLKMHNKDLHYDLGQKLPCKMCDSILSQPGNLKRHYRVKHKLPEYQVFAIVTKDLDLKTALAITSAEELEQITGEFHILKGEESNMENLDTVQKYPGIFYIKDPETDKIVIRKFSNISSLFDYVKNPIKNAFNLLSTDISEDAYKPFTVEYLQQHPQQLLFEITPREIIQFLLESMSGYPVLWEFHKDFYNKEYIKAIESLCELVNEKWSLNIEPLQMCRSITRIFRFYRFLFPFDTIKTFAEYFEKCAGFLPAATIEIPHSRCAHCFCCFQRDKELRTHLCTQHKSLKWSYKCLHCCEEFNTLQDFEFHKRLPHYLEAFICTQCNKKHVGYKDYKRHTHNRKADVPRKYICNICQKAFKSNSELKVHKVYHAEKQFHCDQCSCKYYTKTALSEHMKKHRNEPMFICDICGIRQSSRKSFKEHLESHGDVKVTCNICNLKIRKYSLLRHLRTIHVPCEGSIEETFRGRGQRYKKGEGSRIFNPNYTKRKRRPADKPRKYDCKVCNILFDRLKDLLEHNRQCHTDRVQKLPCKMCDITVAYTTSLKRHYRGIHKLAEYQIFAIVDKYMDVNTVLEMTPNQALEEFIK